jgi:hypothetical protein
MVPAPHQFWLDGSAVCVSEDGERRAALAHESAEHPIKMILLMK